MNMTIDKQLKTSDFLAIEHILRAAKVFSEDEINVAVELAQDTLSGKDKYDFIFIRNVDQQLLGYTCFGKTPLTAKTYDLYWLAVNPPYQKNGIANRLLAETLKTIAAAGGAHLYAETSSMTQYAAAHSFYEKMGFMLAATFRDFYKDGDDKRVYYKSVK